MRDEIHIFTPSKDYTLHTGIVVSATSIIAYTVYSLDGFSWIIKAKRTNINREDGQHFHQLFFISIAQNIGCQSLPLPFIKPWHLTLFILTKCELFIEKKTKVPSTVALLSPAAYRHRSHPHWQHTISVAWTKPPSRKTETK